VILIGSAFQIEKAKVFIIDYLAEFGEDSRDYKHKINFRVYLFNVEGKTKTISNILKERHPDVKFSIESDQKDRSALNE
jgi:hypothetical protein